MKKVLSITIILLVLSLGANVIFFSKLSSNDLDYEVLNKNNHSKYLELTKLINTQFSISGYTEILGDKNFLLALPLESKENDLIGRQKVFIYKGREKECIVYITITANKKNLMEDEEWSTSYSYLPKTFNNMEGEYKSSYSDLYPDVQVATNSFNFNGCHISLLSISNNNTTNAEMSDIAAEELLRFSNSLLLFLNERNYDSE